MTIIEIDSGALRCETPDGQRLGIPTGLGSRRFNGADTVALRKSPGLIIDGGGQTRDWTIERFIEHDGQMIALGPWIEGTRPWNTDSFGPGDIAALLPVARALLAVGAPLSSPHFRTLRRLPDGGCFAAPAELSAWILEAGPEEDARRDWEPWNHPELSGEDSWTFALGVMAWSALDAGDPCRGETGEERRERLRRGVVPSITAVAGAIDPGAADIIDRSLAPGDTGRPGLEDWASLARRWVAGGITGPVDAERTEKAVRRAETAEKALKARRWFRRSGWKVLTIAAVVISVFAVAAPPIRKALESPATAGMPPIDVARAYYNAIDSLDSELMDDCLARKAGQDDIRQVDMIFVTHKVRQGYEQLGELPRAGDWLRDGRPELPQGVWAWGITGLELEQLPDGRIRAAYRFWGPEEDGNPADASGTERMDILSFGEARRSWEITGIERTTGD